MRQAIQSWWNRQETILKKIGSFSNSNYFSNRWNYRGRVGESSNNKILFLLFFILASSIFLQAQQLPTFTNYNHNWPLLNPATVSTEYFRNDFIELSVQTTLRQQWAGLEDAPKTQTLAVNWIPENANYHTGLQVINDKTGAIGFTGAYAQFAYRIALNRASKISIGLNAGLVQYRAKVTQVRLQQSNDLVASSNGTRIYPDFGIGLFYQFKDQWYAGISIPQTFGLNTLFQADNREYGLERVRHYYALAGANWYFDANKTTFFSLSAWAKKVAAIPLTLDALLTYQFQDVFWLGLGGGSSKYTHLEVGVIIGNGLGYWNGLLHVGFGFDYALDAKAQLLGRTMELSMRYSWER